MTDHYQAALDACRLSEAATWKSDPDRAIQEAQVHATLALAEQQRIANLIALAGSQHPLLREQVAADAANALAHWNYHENSDLGGWHELCLEIARTLRIETQ